MILVTRNTFVGGRFAGLQTSTGVLFGNLVHITYCTLGIGLIISRSIVAFSALKFAAAAYLIYLGVTSLRSGAGTLGTDKVETPSPKRTWLAQGFVNNVLNPKGALFYLGVFTTVITPETSASALVVVVLCMFLVSASFSLLFVYTLDRPLVRGSIDRTKDVVSRIFGGLLVLLGIRVASMSRYMVISTPTTYAHHSAT